MGAAPLACAPLTASSSKSVDGRNSRPRRHALGWDDDGLATLVQYQFAEIVEQVVDFGVRNLAILYAP
jgi:hypothetical protein